MSVNLLDLVKGQLTDAVVGKAAEFLGETPDATKSGIGAAVPSLITGLISKAGSSEGASGLLSMISNPEVTGLLGNVGNLMGGDKSLVEKGGSLLSSLLGDKLGGVAGVISSVAGFKNSGSAKGLLSMVAPLVMGTVAKQVGGSGVSGLMGLLSSQAGHLEKSAPAGLMDKLTGALGVGSLASLAGGLGSVSGKLGDVTSSIGDSMKGATSNVGGSIKNTSNSAGENIKKGGNKFLPILALVAAALVALFAWKKCGSDVKDGLDKAKDGVTNVASDAANVVKKAGDKVVDGAKDVTNSVKETGSQVVDGMKDVVKGTLEDVNSMYNATTDMIGKNVKGFEFLGTFQEIKLKDGSTMIVLNKGFEKGLIDFINSDKPADKTTWFNLRRVLFKTGSSSLDAKSNNQIDNVVRILKAYPNVNLKLGGYTDNTGNAANNKKLSQKRANSVMKSMISKGVAANRLAAEGYGVEHPVADNATEEGRALNRRVSARVSKK